MHKIDEKDGAEQYGFFAEIDSLRKVDAEIVCIRHGLLEQTAPFFDNFAQFLFAVFYQKCPGMQNRSESLKYFAIMAVQHRITSSQYAKTTFNGA